MIHSKSYALQATLADHLVPVESRTVVRNLLLMVAGTLALTLSAKVQIPFWPVPMTTQTLVLLAMSMAYGWRLAAMTVLMYMAAGAIGLPVFAGTPEKGIGLAYMVGPTGGYLLGFVLAAIVMGNLAERGWDRGFGTTALAMLVGNIVIYIPGLLWLGSVIGFDKPILQLGLAPFVLADIAKLLLAAVAFPAVWRMISRVR